MARVAASTPPHSGPNLADATRQLAGHGYATVSEFARQHDYKAMHVWSVINGMAGATPDTDSHTIYQHLATLCGQARLDGWRRKGKNEAKQRRRAAAADSLATALAPALALQGLTLAALAEAHGWPYGLMIQVAVGRSRGLRGESKQIRETLLAIIAAAAKPAPAPATPHALVRFLAVRSGQSIKEYLKQHGFEYKPTVKALRGGRTTMEFYGRICALLSSEYGYTMPEPSWVSHDGHRFLHELCIRGLYPAELARRAACSRYYVTLLFGSGSSRLHGATAQRVITAIAAATGLEPAAIQSRIAAARPASAKRPAAPRPRGRVLVSPAAQPASNLH